jgi:hypothetical protein
MCPLQKMAGSQRKYSCRKRRLDSDQTSMRREDSCQKTREMNKMDSTKTYRLIKFEKEDLRKARVKKINVTKFCRDKLHELIFNCDIEVDA